MGVSLLLHRSCGWWTVKSFLPWGPFHPGLWLEAKPSPLSWGSGGAAIALLHRRRRTTGEAGLKLGLMAEGAPAGPFLGPGASLCSSALASV